MTSDRRPHDHATDDGPVADTAALILFYQSTLDAMSPSVAVLNRRGIILAVNAAWRRFLSDNAITDGGFSVGGNYLELCDRTADAGAAAQAVGIRDLLAGGSGPFRQEYRCPWTGRCWSRMSAVRVGPTARPYILLSHEDITDQRLAESQRRSLSGRLLLAEDEERRRIGRDIHDGAAQKLAAAKLMLARGEAGAAEAQSLLAEAIEDLRALADRLHPPMLEPLGLVAAIRRLAGRFGRETGVEMKLDLPEAFPRLTRPVEITLHRAAQEALENVQRHSGSPRAELCLFAADHYVRLVVRDHGKGLGAGGDDGEGLAGLRLRVEQLGGHATLADADPGAVLTVDLPLLEADEEQLAEAGG